jgi:hypothetical protein
VKELEKFIQDWYWDESSHEFARQTGRFLLQFLEHLETTGLSRRTLNKHASNCWLIGKFECDYGYHFKLMVSDSKYAIASYQTAWRKLAEYVRSSGQAA